MYVVLTDGADVPFVADYRGCVLQIILKLCRRRSVRIVG